MSRVINFYKVTKGIVKKHAQVYNISGTHVSSLEIKNKACELYNKYKCDGILIITIKKNIYGDNIGGNELYYDGNIFTHNTLNISFVNGLNIYYKKH